MRLVTSVVLNIIFYVSFIVFSLHAVPGLGILVICSAFMLPRRRALRRLRRAISWYGAVIIRILPFPFVRIAYRDYATHGLGGPYVFICNHRSASDPFLMAMLPHEAIQVVNVWPFRLPVLGVVAKIAGYLSVREMPFEDFLRKAKELLREGVSIVTFPEGTRSRDTSVGQFHSAIFRVALETRAPIVPLCITGNEKIPPIGSPWLQPGVIKMHRLKPLPWEEYGALSPFKLKNHVRRIIVDEVSAMEKAG